MGECYNTITVNAPIDKVWQTVRNFHDLSWAKGVVEKTEVVGSLSGDQLGAQRVLNDAFHETLVTLSDLEHRVEYSIDDGPGPVAKDQVRNYIGHLSLFPVTADNTTFVEWTSTYDSPDSGAVGELCNPIYQALLGALRQHFA